MQKTITWKCKFVGPSRGDGQVGNRPCPRKSDCHLILDCEFVSSCSAASNEYLSHLIYGRMQSSSSYTMVVYDKNLECHWTACFELLNGNITLHYAIPMPNWNSAIYYKCNLFIYEIITWHVEQTISLLIRFFSRD